MKRHRRRKLAAGLLAFLGCGYLLPGLTAQDGATKETVISSHRLEMQGTEEKNFFYFEGAVEVRGTNLRLSCERLTVVSAREGAAEEGVGEIGAIEKIVARGDVEIHQAGRSAYAGLAEVDPRAGTVTLSENPRVTDGETEVTGYQFVLHRGEKRFESIPEPDAGGEKPGRSVVRLGAMPDLGFNQEEEAVDLNRRLESGENEKSVAPQPGEDDD